MADIDELRVFLTGDRDTPYIVKGCGSKWGLHRRRDGTLTVTEFGRIGDLMGHALFSDQAKQIVSLDNTDECPKLTLKLE
jgi:hypothetical protein